MLLMPKWYASTPCANVQTQRKWAAHPKAGVSPATDRRLFYCVRGALADTSLMPSRLTVAVLMLDIETEWTPSRPLLKSSG